MTKPVTPDDIILAIRLGYGVEDIRVDLGATYTTIAAALEGHRAFAAHRALALRYHATRHRAVLDQRIETRARRRARLARERAA